MSYCRAINASIPCKSLKVMANKKLRFTNNLTLTTCRGSFIPVQITNLLKNFNTCKNEFSHDQTLWTLIPMRNFSTTRTDFSSKGSNRDQELKNSRIAIACLSAAVLVLGWLLHTIEPHEDYVIILPENKK